MEKGRWEVRGKKGRIEMGREKVIQLKGRLKGEEAN